MSQPLKPCPFCGGAAYFGRVGTPRVSCIVSCEDCGAQHEGPDEGDQSGTSWNRRALPAVEPTEPTVAQVEHLAEELCNAWWGRDEWNKELCGLPPNRPIRDRAGRQPGARWGERSHLIRMILGEAAALTRGTP